MTTVVDEQTDSSLDVVWPSSATDGVARSAALEVLHGKPRVATSLVTYQSRNSLLIVVDQTADAERALEGVNRDELHTTILVSNPKRETVALSEIGGLDLVEARLAYLEGHLGKFVVRIIEGGEPINLASTLGHHREEFDFILDMSSRPNIAVAVPPPGYYSPQSDQALREALESFPDLIGEFDKPKYFNYNPNICAHVSSRITGCTRCLDTCPTGAIRSLAEQIEIDPFLCQGAGVCATACPTGAITYQFPRVSDLLEKLRRALRRYFDAGGANPWLLILDDAHGSDIAAESADRIPENVIPVVVEETGSVGLDTWLSALCYGAHGVTVACPPTLAPQVRTELEHQAAIANTLMESLGLPKERIRILTVESGQTWYSNLPAEPGDQVVPPTGFAAMEEKRTTLRLALDHLYENSPSSPQQVELPQGSPFGEIRVDRNKCTLCMACVSVCPASALHDGQDLPKLDFIEANCVQCGICERACPENAINLFPLYSFNSEKRLRKRTLNEEKPFLCVGCGKPFTTMKMMETMREKLSGHWMYQDPEQRKRLEMCEDCRVEDMFVKSGGMDPNSKQS